LIVLSASDCQAGSVPFRHGYLVKTGCRRGGHCLKFLKTDSYGCTPDESLSQTIFLYLFTGLDQLRAVRSEALEPMHCESERLTTIQLGALEPLRC
jgi:hypothetical protein